MYRSNHYPREVALFTPGLTWQRGRGHSVMKAQRGGNIFSALFRAIVPAAKSLIRSTATRNLGRKIGQKLLGHTAQFTGDVIQGRSPKEAMEARLQAARQQVGQALKKSGRRLDQGPSSLSTVSSHSRPPTLQKKKKNKKTVVPRKYLRATAKKDLFR